MSSPTFECPRCHREWHIAEDGKVRCHACGYEAIVPVYECPKCGSQALVLSGKAGISMVNQFSCFSCGSQWNENELERCPECYQWKPGGEFEELIICRSSVGFYVCHTCYEKIFK